MSQRTHCDGCDKPLTGMDRAIHGNRADGMQGAFPLPDGEFDWCLACAKIAFRAVLNARQTAERLTL